MQQKHICFESFRYLLSWLEVTDSAAANSLLVRNTIRQNIKNIQVIGGAQWTDENDTRPLHMFPGYRCFRQGRQVKLQEELIPIDDETSDLSNEKHSTAAAPIQGHVQVAEPLGVTSAMNEYVEFSEEHHEIQTDLNDYINEIKPEPDVVEHSGQLDDEDGKEANDDDDQVKQEGLLRTNKKDKDTPSSLRTSISMSLSLIHISEPTRPY